MTAAVHAIPAATQRRWLRWLFETWSANNDKYLGGGLRPPQFALDAATTRLGRWVPLTRTIHISIPHLVESVLLDVELTLRHEMAHQVVSEMFDADDAPPHGALFGRACRMLDLEGSPRTPETWSPAEKRVMRRVRKLMNLGRSPNQHEAESAIAAANRLLLKHNLSLSESDGAARWRFRWVGKPVGRIQLERKLMSAILQDFFFVRTIWIGTTRATDGANVSVLEIIGRPHNLDIAEYVHEVLGDVLDRLWAEYRKGAPRSGRGLAQRNAYRVGVLMGFREHLESQRAHCREEGLVWLGDPGLEAIFERRFPRRHGLARSYYRTGQAHSAGRDAGRKLRIHGGLGRTGATSRGRALLPGGTEGNA